MDEILRTNSFGGNLSTNQSIDSDHIKEKKFIKLKDGEDAGLQQELRNQEKILTGDQTLSKERLFYKEKQSRFGRRSNSLDFIDQSGEGERRSSLYELKNIENPVITKGNKISSRTNLLFEQYKRDMESHTSSENLNFDIGDVNNREPIDLNDEEKTRAQEIREEKERELRLVKEQYQKRLEDEQREQEEERERQRAQQEIKCRKSLGDVKNAYLKIAKGESYKHSDSEDELDENDGASNKYDKHGVLIEKSGGKEQVVKSAHSINNIRERFNSIGKTGWKKSNSNVDDLVTGDVKSAKSMFTKVGASDQSTSYIRPVQKKVLDPATLMEQRKKITYGEDGEIPQDNIVKKSVVIDESEIGKTSEALNVYKNLECKTDTVSQKSYNRSFSGSQLKNGVEPVEKNTYPNGHFLGANNEDKEN